MLESLSFEFKGQQQNIQAPKGDVLYQFRKDVNEGKLPTISWLTASERFSDHPSSPWYGAWYISEIMDILTKNPEVWKKTIFIVTYDENDGYFDHAPSFVAADPKRPETGLASEGIDTGLEYCYKQDELRMGVVEHEARTGPIGMGFRVPLLVASPWSRGGWVNSQLFDHTSTLMFLERFIQEKYGKTVREANISAWRRTVVGDLTSVFRPYNSQGAQLDYLKRDKHVVSIAKARYREVPSNYAKLTAAQMEKINHTPHDSESMPQQEKGVRPACALPYELYADCRLSDDGTQCEVRLSAANHAHGASSAGAPFNVYLRNLKENGVRAATYTVKSGDTLTAQYPLALFADSHYTVEIHGPNGFYRILTGSGSSLPVETRVEYEYMGGKCTGNVLVHLRNRGHGPAKVAIAWITFIRAKPVTKLVDPTQEISVIIPLEQSHGWYDFTVTSDAAHSMARFAGRVETGRASKSDPAMGRTI